MSFISHTQVFQVADYDVCGITAEERHDMKLSLYVTQARGLRRKEDKSTHMSEMGVKKIEKDCVSSALNTRVYTMPGHEHHFAVENVQLHS